MASNQVSKRYAQAWIDAAKEKSATASLKGDLAAISSILAESTDFAAFIKSPIISANEQANVVNALAKQAKFDSITLNMLLVLVQNRRLAILPAVIADATRVIAEEAGEVQAVVTSAAPLGDAEVKDLCAALAKKLGKQVSVDTIVNPDIIGGLVVRIGSTLIDDSVKTKLERLQRHLQTGSAA